MRSFRESEDRASATASDLGNSSSLIDRSENSVSNDRVSISGEFSGAQLPEGSKVRERQGFRARHILRITYLSPQGADCRLDVVFSGAHPHPNPHDPDPNPDPYLNPKPER